VLDGEVIVVNDEGLSDFGALQNWRSEADGHLVYYVFDILWNEGISLLNYSLLERRKILQSIVPAEGLIRMSNEVKANGIELFEVAASMGLEGIIAKKIESGYTPGIRSKEWLKIKTEKRQEAVIGGYTKNEKTSKKFSALLMGVYDSGEFVYIGPVGTGFNQKMQQEILDKLSPLKTAKCPFKEVPEYNKPSRFRPNPPKAEVTWVKPQIVAEISFRASTKDGALRQPSFKGLREDKKATQVTFENTTQTTDIINSKAKDKSISKGIFQKPKPERKSLLNPVDETQVRNVNGHEIKFTNLSKIFWPKEKVTKRDMLNYYYQIAPYMLPYMKDRPQTLNRYPHGINGESFYQKDITGKAPAWIKGFPYYSESDARQKNFLVCTDEASLMYIASLGCIEMNPWSSRAQSADNPDWCIIDLDPDTNSFEEVITAARVTKDILDQLKVPSYCKTSGSSGLHIYIPFSGNYTYEDSKEFARKIVTLVHRQIPSFTSIERLTQKRKGKLYLDFLQNRPQATVASAYSLRPKPGATVSAPLEWDEVKPGLRMKDFTIFNMIDRVKEKGDLFEPVLGKGINLEKTLKAIEGMMK
jgi:bifunctional non-homologous end joining protein LigD